MAPEIRDAWSGLDDQGGLAIRSHPIVRATTGRKKKKKKNEKGPLGLKARHLGKGIQYTHFEALTRGSGAGPKYAAVICVHVIRGRAHGMDMR